MNVMYLYNSATHKKAEFTTHTPGHVEMLSLIHISEPTRPY